VIRHFTLSTGTKLEEVYIIAGKKRTAFSINNDNVSKNVVKTRKNTQLHGYVKEIIVLIAVVVVAAVACFRHKPVLLLDVQQLQLREQSIILHHAH